MIPPSPNLQSTVQAARRRIEERLRALEESLRLESPPPISFLQGPLPGPEPMGSAPLPRLSQSASLSPESAPATLDLLEALHAANEKNALLEKNLEKTEAELRDRLRAYSQEKADWEGELNALETRLSERASDSDPRFLALSREAEKLSRKAEILKGKRGRTAARLRDLRRTLRDLPAAPPQIPPPPPAPVSGDAEERLAEELDGALERIAELQDKIQGIGG